MRVALVVMPLASADRPSLAAGLLKASLLRRGIACDVKHFNLTLWKMLGAETYRFLSLRAATTALVGEWAFSQAFFGEPFSTWESYRDEVLADRVQGIGPEGHAPILALREIVPAFLRVALEACDWSAYDVVGFTSTFEQTMPSLSLARAIRRRHPRVRVVLGGANFEPPMGRPYLEAFDFVDFIANGEADASFPALCEALRNARPGPYPGFLSRDDGGVVDGGRAEPVPMDEVPVPDYHDYFRVLSALTPPGGRSPVTPWLPVEASRGCWWGEKSHCTFCGLNAESMGFRRKSASRVLAEVDELHGRHGPLPLQFADNILGMGAFRDLLPAWAARPSPPVSFFEVKANLRRSQLILLKAAGVSAIQPGIESLSDPTLVRMRKGTTAAQNIACLRWGMEAGVSVYWNLLYGFPGEAPEELDATLSLLPKLVHLPPPSAAAPIRLDRFSPYFERPSEHGFTFVQPMPAYRHVYPFDDEALRTVASYFRYEHPGLATALSRGGALGSFFHLWEGRSREGACGVLTVRPDGDGHHVLSDTRFTRPAATRRLSPTAEAILLAADAPVPMEVALDRAAGGAPGATAGALREALEELIDRDAVVHLGDRLVTLATLPTALSRGRLVRSA